MVDTSTAAAAVVVVLLAAGGVAATTGVGPFASTAQTTDQPGPANVNAAASLADENVTVSVTAASSDPVSNVTVLVDGDTVGTTGENGTVRFNLTNATDGDDLTISLNGEHFKASLDYYVTDTGSLVLLEESYEYQRKLDDDD